jgi:DNA-binding PucR family transcriptional regulator
MITVLLPGFSPAQARDEVAKLRATLPANVAVSAGIAGPVQGVKCLAKAYRDARRFCEALIALDRAGQTASLEDLGMYGLLISASSSVWAAETAARLLGDLVRYDQEHNTDLLATVERYVNSRTAKEAADDLYVHINTLYQRLQRASTILNRDLFDPRQRLEVQLALGINQFLGSRHSEAS